MMTKDERPGSNLRAPSMPVILGTLGMLVSFGYLTSDSPLDVTAGAAGFVAGAVLIAAGLVSSSVRAAAESKRVP